MVIPHSLVRAASDQVSSDIGEETVILGRESEMYYGLDEIGAWVWRNIRDGSTVGKLHDPCLARYDVDAEECGRDLLALLNDLARAGLIEVE